MEILKRSSATDRCCFSSSSKVATDILDMQSLINDEASLAETASVGSSDDAGDLSPCCSPVHVIPDDSIENDEETFVMCYSCQQQERRRKLQGYVEPPARDSTFSRCQVRFHNHESSCWLVAGDIVYDATPLLKSHPGGKECILRKGGGIEDCSMDIFFHSPRGRDMWNHHRIGRLIECGEEPPLSARQWWMFWAKN